MSRSDRIADLIKRTVVEAIQREMLDPRLEGLLITGVDMAARLTLAKVFFTLPDESRGEEVLKVLRKASGFFRTYIAQHAGLRYTPKLTFVYDYSILAGENLSRLIDKVTDEEV